MSSAVHVPSAYVAPCGEVVSLEKGEADPARPTVPPAVLKVANAIAFVGVVVFNAISSSGQLSEYSIGDISDLHPTRITPAGGAFSIWGAIYFLEAMFVLTPLFGWNCKCIEGKVMLVGPWFVLACVFNAIWITVFVQGTDAAIWSAAGIIFLLLATLLRIYTNCQLWRPTNRNKCTSPLDIVLLLSFDAHFSIYASWVSVASIVNVSTALKTTGWSGGDHESTWSVIMQVVALVVAIFMVGRSLDPVWGAVLCWATGWIATNFRDDEAIFPGSVAISVTSGLLALGAVVVRLRRGKQ